MVNFTCDRCTRVFLLEDDAAAKGQKCPACAGRLYEPPPSIERVPRRHLWIYALVAVAGFLFALILFQGTYRVDDDTLRAALAAKLHTQSSHWRDVTRQRAHVEGEVAFQAEYAGREGKYQFEVVHAPAQEVTRVAVYRPAEDRRRRALYAVKYDGPSAAKAARYSGADSQEKQLLELQSLELCEAVRSVMR